jgi:hypothetical protein
MTFYEHEAAIAAAFFILFLLIYIIASPIILGCTSLRLPTSSQELVTYQNAQVTASLISRLPAFSMELPRSDTFPECRAGVMFLFTSHNYGVIITDFASLSPEVMTP